MADARPMRAMADACLTKTRRPLTFRVEVIAAVLRRDRGVINATASAGRTDKAKQPCCGSIREVLLADTDSLDKVHAFYPIEHQRGPARALYMRRAHSSLTLSLQHRCVASRRPLMRRWKGLGAGLSNAASTAAWKLHGGRFWSCKSLLCDYYVITMRLLCGYYVITM